jgi:hypothetical protein
MIDQCPREADVVEAIAVGRWAGDGSTELASHAASCVICQEVALVAAAMRDEYESARAGARVPRAGLVWWRAQLRARQQVAETAGRPITYVQAAAGALAACLLFMLGGLAWPWLRESVAWVDWISQVVDTGRFWLPLALAIGVWLVLAPVVFLFALSHD